MGEPDPSQFGNIIHLSLSLSLLCPRVRWSLHTERLFLSADQLSEDLHKQLFMIALLYVGRRDDPVPPSVPPSSLVVLINIANRDGKKTRPLIPAPRIELEEFPRRLPCSLAERSMGSIIRDCSIARRKDRLYIWEKQSVTPKRQESHHEESSQRFY